MRSKLHPENKIKTYAMIGQKLILFGININSNKKKD